MSEPDKNHENKIYQSTKTPSFSLNPSYLSFVFAPNGIHSNRNWIFSNYFGQKSSFLDPTWPPFQQILIFLRFQATISPSVSEIATNIANTYILNKIFVPRSLSIHSKTYKKALKWVKLSQIALFYKKNLLKLPNSSWFLILKHKRE